MDAPPTPAPPGRALERAVGELFAADGWSVTRNVVRTGRSGARHEVDVLARRDDGIVAAEVAVECKHWAAPVDTAVVARARLLSDDLGVDRVVVAAPGGWAPAAALAARETGVVLWGADDLAARLGRRALSLLSAPPAPAADGLPRRVDHPQAVRALRVHAAGALGLRRERLEWAAPAWLPLAELTLACAAPGGRARRRMRLTEVHVAFETVTGATVARADAPLPTDPVALDAPVLPAALAPGTLARRVQDAARRAEELVQPTARARAGARLGEMGVPPGTVEVAVAASRTLVMPVAVGLVTARDGRRLAVLDAVTGRVDEALSDALTPRLADVVAALAPGAPA